MISTSNNNKYIESKNIRVFPCAYRGYYFKNADENETITTYVFDPEARATTEANFTNTFHKLSAAKDSYVISWTPDTTDNGKTIGTLKCVIGGYYFEIYNHSLEDFFYTDSDDNLKSYALCIQIEDVSLGTSEIDSDRTTKVLKSFADTSNYLDIYIQAANDYAFTGLILSEGNALGTSNLVPFITDYEFVQLGIINEENPYIGSYYLKDSLTDQYEIITSSSSNFLGETAYARVASYRVDPSRLPVTNLLDVGTGEFSIRMLEDITETADNTTVASGNYAIALGKHTKAEGLASVAMGNNTVASGHGAISAGIKTTAEGDGAASIGNESKALEKGSFAAGNNTTAAAMGSIALGNDTTAEGEGALAVGNTTTAKATGSIALGSNTIATEDNQVVIGSFNKVDESKAFIIANGDSDRTDSANTFTVSYTGNIKALGNLEINGNQNINGQEKAAIASTGNGANDFILGTPSAGSKGSIKVYGAAEAETPVFQVTETGTTTIAGNTAITSSEQSSTNTSGALKVAGGAGIAKNLNVGGNTKITGNLEVLGTSHLGNDSNDTLTVAGQTIINNGLTVNGQDITTTILNTSLEVRDAVKLNQNLTVKQNVTLAASDEDLETPFDSPNTLTLGSPKLNVSGALDIYGINTEKVFSVTNTGNTVISGDLTANTGTTKLSATEISGAAIITNTTDTALTVEGDATITKNLRVDGETTFKNTLTVDNNTTINGSTIITDETDYTNTNDTITAALKVAGGAHIAKKLHVTGDTTFYDNLEIAESRVAIKKTTASTAANNGALVVSGGVGIGGDLNSAGNATFSQNLTIAGTGNVVNSLKIGNESSSNKGGTLQIYGAGTTPVFEVTAQGDTTITGNLLINKNIKAGNESSLSFGTGNTALTISKTGISNLTSLDVSGPVNAAYFNAKGYTTSSDMHLKCEIEDYKFKNSILNLPIKRFEYLQDDTHTKHIGCLAQDLQLICPEFVVETPDGSLAIQESKLIYALLQEVKELKEKVTQLERK